MTRLTVTINHRWQREVSLHLCTEWKWNPTPVRFLHDHSWYIERCFGFVHVDWLYRGEL